MDKKPIGSILGDLVAVLVNKEVINIDELEMIVGDAYFEELVKKANMREVDND